jgi:uncharacterized delta-60 repeat protein
MKRHAMKPRRSSSAHRLLRSTLPLLGGALLAFAPSISLAQSPGEQDHTFATGAGADANVLAILLQPNGQVLAAGVFDTYNGVARAGIVRLNPDGSLDTFNPGLALTGYSGGAPTIDALGLQADGSVIVAGLFDVIGQTPGNGVARLTPAGALDSTFNAGSGGYDDGGSVGSTEAVAILPSQQILVGGDFATFNGTGLAGLVRLNADGSVDPTFNAGGTGITGNGYGTGGGDVTSIVQVSNGQILIGGHFSAYNGTPASCIARLNADGTIDNTFQVGEGPDEGVNVLAVQANGQILVGGGFNNFDGVNVPNLVRLNTDGSLDTSYDPDSNTQIAIDGVSAIVIQPDGSAIIGGDLYADGGLVNSPINGVARITSDGTLDTSFDAGAVPNLGQAASLALQPNGELLVAGNVNGTDSDGNVFRLYDVSSKPPLPTATIKTGVAVTDESGGAPATFIVKLSAARTSAITVHYSVGGTAQSGRNYHALTGTVKFMPGKTSKTIIVTPINRHIDSDAKLTVKVTIDLGAGYAVGATRTAKVKIVENH